jgi:hypothetical protein
MRFSLAVLFAVASLLLLAYEFEVPFLVVVGLGVLAVALSRGSVDA